MKTTKMLLRGSIAIMAFFSCKKENSKLNSSQTALATNNAVADSVLDSSLQKGLVAWYTFNGDVLDHSGHNNNVVFNSATPVKGINGVNATAYNFDGESNYMQVKNSKSLNPQKITIIALIKPKGYYAGTCHDNRIISKGYNDYSIGRYTLGYNDQPYYNYAGCSDTVATKHETFTGTYGDGQGSASGTTNLLDKVKTNTWYVLAYTFNGTYSNLYVNGILKAKTQKSTAFNPNAQDIFIGRNEDPSYPYYFNGVLDDLKIYNRALKPSEIAALSNTNQ